MFLALGIAAAAAYRNRASIFGWIGELKTPKPPSAESPQASEAFRKRQAVREYNALLGTTSAEEPNQSVCVPCLAKEKGSRRKERHDLIRNAQSMAVNRRLASTGHPLAKSRVNSAWTSVNSKPCWMIRIPVSGL